MLTNTQLLDTSGFAANHILTGLEQQRRYCLQVAMTPAPCPMCFTPLNQIDAAQLMLDDFPADDTSKLEFKCPHCDTELVETVPFMASGPAKYQWRRKTPIATKQQLDDAGI